MRILWASATNIAAIFNATTGLPHYKQPTGWTYELSAEKVNHAFQLHALLLEHLERGDVLTFLNIGDAEDRLLALVRSRNNSMRTLGDSAARKHVCDVCCIRVPGNGADNLGMLKVFKYPHTRKSNASFRPNRRCCH